MADHQHTLTQYLIPVAQVVGLTGSALLSGLIGAMSYVSVPTLLDLPATLAAQTWKRTYDIGVRTAPPLAITCSMCFGFLASQTFGMNGRYPHLAFDPTSQRGLYTAAMVAIPSVVPYTIGMMKATNDQLMLKAREGEKAAVSDAQTKELLAKWGRLNFMRAAVVLVGSVLGCAATVLKR